MSLFKNLKDKASSALGDNIKDIIDKKSIVGNLQNIKEGVNAKLDKLTSDWQSILEQVLSGDYSFFTTGFLSEKDENYDDGTKKDCTLPFRDEIERHLRKNGYSPRYSNKALFGIKEANSEKGSTILTNMIAYFPSNAGFVIANSIVWMYDLEEGSKDALISNCKFYFGDSYNITANLEKQIVINRLLEDQESSDKDVQFKLIDKLVSNLDAVSIPVYQTLLPKVTQIELENERNKASEEEERKKKAAAAAREEGLNKGYIQTLDGDISIRKIQKNFTEDYPYLRLGFFMVQTGQKADREGGTISHINSDTLLGKVRSFRGYCKIRIGGSDTPESLEKKFRSESGLVIKICYNDKDDSRYYIGKDSDYYKKPIYDLNRKFKKSGYMRADIS